MRIKIRLMFLAGISIIIASCSSNPYGPTNKAYKKQTKELSRKIRTNPVNPTGQDFVGTTNFGLRKPNFVIIHHTAQNSTEQTLKTFTLPRTQVSAHYVIGKDGAIYQMLNDYLRAWHGGAAILKKTHASPVANFIGHSDIAPGRKVDPNITFPWKTLAENGYGLWQDETLSDSIPETFNQIEALRIIGYDIKNPQNAMKSFQLHFSQKEITGILTEEEIKILFNLYKKYL